MTRHPRDVMLKLRSAWPGAGSSPNARQERHLHRVRLHCRRPTWPAILALLDQIKSRIRAAQIKAALAVNRELVELYWSIGRDIVERQRVEGWGKSIVEQISGDIQLAFPGIAGFSARNIWKMRQFYLAWPQEPGNLSQPVADLGESILPQAVREIPWGHNTELLFKLTDRSERLWYAQQTIANGWSRSMLLHWIESDLHARQGKALHNFQSTLPAPQSDLAAELIKDPYNFDFLTLRTDAAERELEQGLLVHIRRFLLELGAGFALVGEQVPVVVDGETYYLDLLFYHLKLRCFVVIDLKVQPFQPEFAGKMNFYLSTIDEQMRQAGDKPSIGLILCRDRKKTVVEYALRDLQKPVGVARYKTRLVESLPVELAGALPSVKQIEAEMQKSLS
jgi:predicted nuclease of restriction endonuclease-like (RecB) superfamily